MLLLKVAVSVTLKGTVRVTIRVALRVTWRVAHRTRELAQLKRRFHIGLLHNNSNNSMS